VCFRSGETISRADRGAAITGNIAMDRSRTCEGAMIDKRVTSDCDSVRRIEAIGFSEWNRAFEFAV
jgi:hypothetical protein